MTIKLEIAAVNHTDLISQINGLARLFAENGAAAANNVLAAPAVSHFTPVTNVATADVVPAPAKRGRPPKVKAEEPVAPPVEETPVETPEEEPLAPPVDEPAMGNDTDAPVEAEDTERPLTQIEAERIAGPAAIVNTPAAPKEASKEAPSTLTLDDLRELLKEIKAHPGLGSPVMVEVVQSFGAKRLPEIPEDKWGDVAAEARRRLKAA